MWLAYPVVRLFNRRVIPTCPFPFTLLVPSVFSSASSSDPSSPSSNLLFLPVPFCILDLCFPSISRSFNILADRSMSFSRFRNKPSRYDIALCLLNQLQVQRYESRAHLLSSFGSADADVLDTFSLPKSVSSTVSLALMLIFVDPVSG